jgi:hypothetical protein
LQRSISVFAFQFATTTAQRTKIQLRD